MSKEELVVATNADAECDSVEEYIDAKTERKLLHKLDRRLSILFSLIFFLLYLDRANIGNAKIAGMVEDLGLSESQFSTISSILYATYTTIQVPGVLLMRRFKANYYLGIMVIICGLITLFTTFVQSFGGLFAVRLLLGLFEGSLFSCMSAYTANCYLQNEIGKRISYFFVSAAISSAFGGLIATGITKIEGGPLERWRYLFLIEGLITILVGAAVVWLLPADPVNIFTDEEEIRVYQIREKKRKLYMGEEKFSFKYVKQAFSSYRTYVSLVTQFCQDICLYGFTTFLPSILKLGLGFDSLQAQYLTIPVYLLGGTIYMIAARFSDKYRIRGPIMIIANIIAIVGYIIVIAVDNNGVKYFGCYLIVVTLLTSVGLNESWIASNTAPAVKRSASIGINQAFGNTAGIVAPQVYRQAPYLLGHWFTIGCLIVASILIAAQTMINIRVNKQRESLMDTLESDEIEMEKGNNSVRFRYII